MRHIPNKIFFISFTFLAIGLCTSSVYAAGIKPSDRAETFEITINPAYNYGKDISGSNGTDLNMNDTWGWGFGFGYNFNEKLNLAWNIGWSSPSYKATFVPDTGTPQQVSGTLSSTSSMFIGTYNFMAKTFTPFVTAGLGWVFVDSNIPSGQVGTGCWWTWYGYYCGNYETTYGTSEFAYGLGLGARWDLGESVFLKAAYNVTWIDNLGNVGTQDFDTLYLTIGFMMQ